MVLVIKKNKYTSSFARYFKSPLHGFPDFHILAFKWNFWNYKKWRFTLVFFLQGEMFKTTQRKKISSKKWPTCKKKTKATIFVFVFVIAVLTIIFIAVIVTNKTDNTEVRNYDTTSIIYNTTEDGTSTLGWAKHAYGCTCNSSIMYVMELSDKPEYRITAYYSIVL